jgi:hypothetical protein
MSNNKKPDASDGHDRGQSFLSSRHVEDMFIRADNLQEEGFLIHKGQMPSTPLDFKWRWPATTDADFEWVKHLEAESGDVSPAPTRSK